MVIQAIPVFYNTQGNMLHNDINLFIRKKKKVMYQFIYGSFTPCPKRLYFTTLKIWKIMNCIQQTVDSTSSKLQNYIFPYIYLVLSVNNSQIISFHNKCVFTILSTFHFTTDHEKVDHRHRQYQKNILINLDIFLYFKIRGQLKNYQHVISLSDWWWRFIFVEQPLWEGQ